jgi:hypothetical protein
LLQFQDLFVTTRADFQAWNALNLLIYAEIYLAIKGEIIFFEPKSTNVTRTPGVIY